MTRDNRQILVNPHSSQEKIPAGALNLGEIGVQHNNVEDAALYVETVADSQSAGTVAKFITEKAIDKKIDDALTVMVNDLQNEIDGINDAVGLPHEGELWDSGKTVWEAIEYTYQEMTAGTAAANTKLVIDSSKEDSDFLTLTAQTDAASSSITYSLGLEGIEDRIESAYTIVNNAVNELSSTVETLSSATVNEIENVVEKVEQLSAATEGIVENIIEGLNYTGVTQEGKPVINVTQTEGLVEAETGNINAQFVEIGEGTGATTLDEAIEDINDAIEEILDVVEANEVESTDGSIVVTPGVGGEKTDLSVNIDNETIVLNDNNELVADLKLSAITPSGANVKEEFALIDHNGNQLGDTVKVYKDSSLYEARLGTMGDTLVSENDPTIVPGTGDTALDLIYHKEDGTYELVKIDVNDFLEESEFQDGLEVDNHVVKVKVDNASEVVEIESGVTAPVLSVSENGVKISNIQAAINYAVSELAKNVNADVTGASSDGKVSVEVIQENTEITDVIVTTDDIASAQDLADEIEAREIADSALTESISTLNSKLDEMKQKLSGVSVSEGTSFENFVKLNVSNDGNGATAITIDDTDLKQAIDYINDDIANEIAARETADAELLGNSASTSSEDSIMGIKKLISELALTLVKDVTVGTGETLVEVAKEDTPEGDIYTISSTQRLNDAVDLAENSVQRVAFAAVADKDETAYGSNAGAEIVDGTINIDLSVIKLDCGEY